MYKIKAEGKEYYSDTLVYVKKAPNGCYVPCLAEEAECIVGKVPEDTIFENADVENFDGGSMTADMLEALATLGGDLMGYYTEKAKEVKAKQDAELEQLKAALQTLGVETEEKEETANAE